MCVVIGAPTLAHDIQRSEFCHYTGVENYTFSKISRFSPTKCLYDTVSENHPDAYKVQQPKKPVPYNYIYRMNEDYP